MTDEQKQKICDHLRKRWAGIKEEDNPITKTSGEILDGDYNREIDIEATIYGLRVDDMFTVEWEWIDAARAEISK